MYGLAARLAQSIWHAVQQDGPDLVLHRVHPPTFAVPSVNRCFDYTAELSVLDSSRSSHLWVLCERPAVKRPAPVAPGCCELGQPRNGFNMLLTIFSHRLRRIWPWYSHVVDRLIDVPHADAHLHSLCSTAALNASFCDFAIVATLYR